MAQSQVIGVLRALLTADTSEYDKAMKGAGQSTEKVADSIERQLAPRLSTITGLVKGMFGSTDMRRAEEYAQAVEKVGGVSRLVESDQIKVNKQLTAAIEHYRVLGTEVPPHIQKLKNELDDVAASGKKLDAAGQASEFFAGKWAQIAAGFSVANLADRAISGIVNLGAAAVANAGHLMDLSAATGLSTEALQVYGQIAKETGASVDVVADSVFKMGVLVEEGSDKTRAALGRLGLQYDKIAAMRPEDQFAAVAKALQGITSEQERNAIGVALMGEKYKALAAAVVEGLDSIRDRTVIVRDEHLKAIDAMETAWQRFWDNAVSYTTAAAGSVVLAVDEMASSWKGRIAGMLAFARGMTGDAVGAMRDFQALSNAGLARASQPRHEDIDLGAAERAAAARQAAADAKKAEKAAEAAAAAAKQWADQVARLRDQFSGAALTKDVAQLTAAIKGLTPAQLANGETMERIAAAALALQDRGGDLAPVFAALDARGAKMAVTFGGLGKSIFDMKHGFEEVIILQDRMVSFFDTVNTKADLPPVTFGGQGVSIFDQAAQRQADSDRRAAAAAGAASAGAIAVGSKFAGAVAGAVQGGGSIFKAVGASAGEQLTSSLATSLSKKAATKLTGSLAGTIGKAAIGAIPIVGPIIGAIGGELLGKLFGGGEGKKANKLRDSLKAEFGDAGGAGLAELVGKYQESTAVQSAYAEFMAAKTQESVQSSFDALKAAMSSTVTDVEAKAARMADALGRAGAATSNILGGFAAKLQPAAAAIDALRSKQADLERAGDVEGAGAVAVQVLDATRQAAVANQTEFDRLGRITLSTFNAYIAQGKSAIEAVQGVGPAIDTLRSSAEAFGFAGSAAYDQLSRWRGLTNDNAALLDSVAGLNDLLSALQTLGAVDAATFADLQAQGVGAFEAMQAAGFSRQEAATQLAPLLENLLAIHEKTGLAIDEETQAVIDQARAEGALKEKQISDQQIMIDGFSALIKAVGGDVPAAFSKWGKASETAAKDVEKAAKSAADGVSKAFDGLAFDVPVSFVGGDGSALPAAVNPDDLPGFARGGIATKPTVGIFGEEGPEALIPLDRGNAFGPRTFVLETDGRAWARVQAPYVAAEVQRLQLSR